MLDIGHEGDRRPGVRRCGCYRGDPRRLHVLACFCVLRTNDKMDIKDPGRCWTHPPGHCSNLVRGRSMAQRTCLVDGCDREAVRRGCCDPHYRRWRKHGDPTLGGPIQLRSNSGATCSINDCVRAVSSFGLCSTHHQRVLRTGTTDPPRRNEYCHVEDCHRREVKLSGLCLMHFKRQEARGTTDPLPPKQIAECLVDHCTRQARGGWGWCPPHYNRYRLTGDPLKTRRDCLIEDELVTGERVCVKCKQRRSLHCFLLNSRSLNGRVRVCDTCASSRSAARYRSVMTKDPTEIPRRSRDAYLKHKYGITQANYETMRDAQNNQCAVCQAAGIVLFVDHDHETGRIRSLLCNDCNLALGHVNDSIEVLRRLISYVEMHRTRKVS